MSQFDLKITNGTVANSAETFQADIGVKDGKIITIGKKLGNADKVVDANGKYVLPGGIEAHCHIEQESSSGLMTSDDYYSGSVSAAFGGNTCFVPFAAQHRGESLKQVLRTYHDRAGPKSVIDYSFHLIISDVNMPIMDGLTFVKQAKEKDAYRFTPILMLTTESGDDMKQAGKAAGVKAWLVKPFKPDVLLSAVSKLA